MDKQSNFSHQQLVDASADTFTSNPDVTMLLATSHDGAYYRPEARSYAEHEARKHNSEVVEINQLTEEGEATATDMISISTTEYDSLIDMACRYLELKEAGAAGNTTTFQLDMTGVQERIDAAVARVANAASSAEPTGLAELVAGATHFYFPKPIPEADLHPFAANLQPIVTAPAAAPKTKASRKATTPKADSAE